jgi:hypothetical protein
MTRSAREYGRSQSICSSVVAEHCGVDLVERKIAYSDDDVVDCLLIEWSRFVAHRNNTPVRYWILIGLQITFVVGCLGVAIFGWWAAKHLRIR